MRYSGFFILMSLILLLSASLTAEISYDLAPSLDIHRGETWYRSDYFNAGVGGGSELIFPLDFTTYGIDLSGSWLKYGQSVISAELRVRKSLNDPGGGFTDRDWLFQNPGLEANFSFSESSVEGSYFDLELEFQYHKKLTESLELGLLFGLGYSKISQIAKGFDGALLIIDTTNLTFDFIRSYFKGDALTYEITHLRPYIGVVPNITLGSGTTLTLKGAWSPFVRFDDRDNHLLRFFTIQSKGNGWGIFASSKLRQEFGNVIKKKKPFIDISFDYRWMQADLGALIQFYRDSPEGYSAGDVLTDDTHLLRSRLYSIGLNFGFMF